MRPHVTFRPATGADAEAVADVYLTSRKRFLPFAPLAHSDDEVREWVRTHMIPGGGVTVGLLEDEVVAMMVALRHDGVGWLDQLYLHPRVVGRGIGRRMLDQAKEDLGPPIRLYTFQANQGARRFYERHGFRAIEFGDGSGNEEGCPDVLYEWRG